MKWLAVLLMLCCAVVGAATSTYYPNSTDCGASWYGYTDSTYPPTGNPGDTSMGAFTGDELNVVSTDDSNYTYMGYGGDGEIIAMLAVFKVVEAEGSITQLKVTFKGYGHEQYGGDPPDQYGMWLYVWSDTGSTWTSGTEGTATSKETLTITITENIGNYISSGGLPYVNACREDTSGGMSQISVKVYYAELEVAYTEASTTKTSGWQQ